VSAAAEYNAEQLAERELTPELVTWLVRQFQVGAGLGLDGWAGPKTIAAIKTAMRFLHSPLPTLADGRAAQVTSSFGLRPDGKGGEQQHDGVDLFYSWRAGDRPDWVGDGGAATKLPSGQPKWGIPDGTMAIAAADGVVGIANGSPSGWRCWIHHSNGLRSGYFHLRNLVVRTGQAVSRGAQLGIVGDNPRDTDARHLHFEVSPIERYEPLDPALYLVG
jgi:murein DD-endopeptidase MepM/ murein hydrolase activator NlpD